MAMGYIVFISKIPIAVGSNEEFMEMLLRNLVNKRSVVSCTLRLYLEAKLWIEAQEIWKISKVVNGSCECTPETLIDYKL